MTLAPATRLGPYEITGNLGAGGMGEVYRARDTRLGREVAVKVLPEEWSSHPDRRARLDREARLLAALNHPNVAAIYGVEDSGGVPALVLELVEGPTLAERLARGPLPVAEAVAIARQLAEALDAAHERGIVHRDLKPANVKVRPDGTVKVLDFGLARAFLSPEDADPDRSQSPTLTAAATREGAVLGTAAYMSPEQARGQPVDKRTDIWAFGCLLYEMLAGRRPFGGPSSSDTLVSVLEREPDYSALPFGTPPSLARLIRRCLQKDLAPRLRDIGDARADLDDLGAGGVTMSAAPSHGRRVAAAAALLAAASAALTLAVVRYGPRAPAEDRPPRFERVTRLVATDAHESGPALSPDGKWIAYLSDARGPADVWVKFVSGGDPVNLTASTGLVVQSADAIGGVEISPDGTQIAFTAGPADKIPPKNSTWVIPAPLGGVPRRFLDSPNQGLRWSPDATRVAYLRAGGDAGDEVWVADADLLNRRRLVTAYGGRHAHWLRWGHDSRHVYFNYGTQNANTEPTAVHRVPVAGGPVEAVIPSVRRAVFPFPDRQGRGLFYAANPDTVDLGLWWRDFTTGRDHRLTSGIGEYAAPSLSADGRRLVATVTHARHFLARLRFEDERPAAEPIVPGLVEDTEPSWAPDGSRLFFSSQRSGGHAIWAARPDLSGAVALTSGPFLDQRPVCSPDGRRIAFLSDRGGRRGLWILPADGGTPRLLTTIEVFDTPSWSADGHRLVVTVASPKGPRLAFVDAETGAIEGIPTPAAASAPAHSPVEDLIAYLEARPGEGTFLRFVDGAGRPVDWKLPRQPAAFGNGTLGFSRDGRRLAILGLPGSTYPSLWVVSRGAPYRQIAPLPQGTYVRGLAWTPDGKALTLGLVDRRADIILAEHAP